MRMISDRDRVEQGLAEALDRCGAPEPLLSAMRHSLLGGGKRLRPCLLLSACRMGNGDWERALPFALAVEMLHTYSLVHDDLPAMDDDTMRRGKPTCHVVFGEGMAVLCGDALFTLAAETMVLAVSDEPSLSAMKMILAAVGSKGMLLGQCMDLEAEKCGILSEDDLLVMHRGKTAALLSACVGAGLRLAGASFGDVQAGQTFGEMIGIAFQIQDDLLDALGDPAVLGKTVGKDSAHGKLTWTERYGIHQAQKDQHAYYALAMAALAPFGDRAEPLRQWAMILSTREA